jgi:uncharacterized protein (DUF4213/DUF364 family)
MTEAPGPSQCAAGRVLERLLPASEQQTVRRVQVGLIYSAVELASGALGVAYTFPESRTCRGGEDAAERPLIGAKASVLLRGLGGRELLASTLGLAAANALLARALPSSQERESDVLDVLRIREGDRVCMVGCFLPVLAELQDRPISITSVDQVAKAGSLPAQEAERLLPSSEVAIITATSLINGTLDHLLELCLQCREVALLGPSTPLLPEAFAGTPVTCLAGIRAQQPDGVLQSIAEGHGFRVFKRYVRKVCLRIAEPRARAALGENPART